MLARADGEKRARAGARPDERVVRTGQVALRHGAGVEEETNDARVAYARFPATEPARYQDGWLSG